MVTFSSGARGFLVAELQRGLEKTLGRGLPSGADGKYGSEVMGAVIDLANQQSGDLLATMRNQRAMFGEAGPAIWHAAGVAWPELYARCLNLTSGFEGTGFSGAVGPKQTGDTAGVTYGIIGFTSFNGELQELLATAGGNNPAEFERIAHATLGRAQYVQMVNETFVPDDNRAFERWALQGGSVRPTVKRFLDRLGETDWMRRMQMQWGFERYFKRAATQVGQLFRAPASDRCYALLYDIAVQNGGLKTTEISDLQARFRREPHLTEYQRMGAINTALIDRLRLAKRPTRIIEDVRSRKGTIAVGSGRVHGEHWVVRSFAL